MKKKPQPKKIVVFWKDTEKYEVYSSLVGFVEKHPGYNRETITHYITRKGVPYQTNELTLIRCNYIDRQKL